MRGPKTALIAAVVVTGVSATILRAQQMFAGSAPLAAVATSATAAADPSLAGRSARQLLRNGLDYLDNYDLPDRALVYLQEAEKRPDGGGLDDSELEQLRDGLSRARSSSARPDPTSASASVRPRGRVVARPGSLVLASAPPTSEDEPIRQVSADASEVQEPTAMDLPSLPPSLAEPAEGPADPLVVAALPDFAADPGPSPVEPAPAPIFLSEIPAEEPPPLPTQPIPLPSAPPEAAPTPVTPPVPSPEPPPVFPAPAEAPRDLPLPIPAPAPMPVAVPPVVEEAPVAVPVDLPPMPEAAPTPPVVALPAEAPAGDIDLVPAPVPLPVVEPRPEPSPAPRQAVTARVPSGPRPVAPAGPRRFAGAPRAVAPTYNSAYEVETAAEIAARTKARAKAAEVAPQPAPEVAPQPTPEIVLQPEPEPVAAEPEPAAEVEAEGFPPLPSSFSATPASPIPAAGSITETPAFPTGAGLRPQALRDIEEMTRIQDEAMRRNPPPRLLPTQTSPRSSDTAGAGDASAGGVTSRLELPRAPSPTEPRPIRVIPVPDAFVPLPAREWDPNRKYWAAAATCHMPLYFQDAVLERYGQGVEQALGNEGRYFSFPLDDPRQSNQRNQLLQPLFSTGLFLTQIAALPYNLIVDPPWEAEYDLGYYRPGDRTPPDTYYLPTTGVGPPLRGRRY